MEAKKKITRIASLGLVGLVSAIGSGCETTPAGYALGEAIVNQTIYSGISGQLDPKGTNVTVNNGVGGSGNYQAPPKGISGPGHYEMRGNIRVWVPENYINKTESNYDSPPQGVSGEGRYEMRGNIRVWVPKEYIKN